MATVHTDSTLDRYNRDHHPVWTLAFSERERKALIDEDLAAGYQVPAILMGVMVFGFLSIVVSVWLAI